MSLNISKINYRIIKINDINDNIIYYFKIIKKLQTKKKIKDLKYNIICYINIQ